MAPDYVRSVYLHGALAERFGSEHRMAVASPAEAVRALAALNPGFLQVIAAGDWQVIRGDLAAGLQFGRDDLSFRLGEAPLHIVPVIAGEAKGVGKIIGGIILALAGFFIGGPAGSLLAWGSRAAQGIGISLALHGASALLSPQQNAKNDRAGIDDRSFVFNGAENVTAQGECVPVVIGRFRPGSKVVATSIKTEAIT